MSDLFDPSIERWHTHSIRWGETQSPIIPMTVADMDFAIPPFMVDGLRARLDHPVLGYTDPGFLKEKIQTYLQKEYQWSVATEAILILPSVANALYLSMQHLLESQDHCLLPTPHYHKFEEALIAHKREYSLVPLVLDDDRWVIDFHQLIKVMKPNSRWLLLCNPHNPTGTVLSLDECKKLSEFCIEYDLMVCSDEIHAPLIIDPSQTHQVIANCLPEMAKRTVTFMSLNKAFNFSGAGLAFGVCENPQWRQCLSSTLQQQSIHPSLFAYTSTALAIEHGDAWRAELLSYLWQSQKIIRNFLSDFPQIHWAESAASYLAWLDFSQIPRRYSLSDWRATGVLPLMGSDFGAQWNTFVRLNYAMPHAQLERALCGIRQMLK